MIVPQLFCVRGNLLHHDVVATVNQILNNQNYEFQINASDIDGSFRKFHEKGEAYWRKVFLDKDVLVLLFRSHLTPEQKAKCITSDPLHKVDKALLKVQRKEFEEQTIESHKRARDFCQILKSKWEMDNVNDCSSYLELKNLPRIGTDILVTPSTDSSSTVLRIPMFDETGVIWNYQSIFVSKGESFKRFRPGAKTKKLVHTIKPDQNKERNELIFIGEGYATCLAVHVHTNALCLVAFSTRNLLDVCEFAVKKYGSDKIRLLVDWDGSKEKNAGLKACQKASAKFRIKAVFPSQLEGESVDFADLLFVPDGEQKIKELAATPVSWEEMPSVEPEQNSGDNSEENVDIGEPEWLEYESVEPDPADFPSKEFGFFIAPVPPKMTWTPNFDEFGRYMAQKFFLKSPEGVTYAYADGFYHARSKLALNNLADQFLRTNTSPKINAEFVRAMQIKSFTEKDDLIAPIGMINLKNGALDVREKKLKRHSPADFFRYKLPHVYQPGARCPNWINFLKRTFQDDQDLINLSAETFGFVLMGGPPPVHKAVFLHGEGRNGKGVFLDTLKFLIGANNFSAVPLHKLGEPFSAVHCDGKLANIVTEVSTKQIESEVFKTAVSGEEVIAAFKRRDEYSFRFNARLILAANKIPYLGDSTTGAHEKFLILPFDHYIKEQNRRGNFAMTDIFPEASGIINWALEGLDRLQKRGRFAEVAAVKAQAEMMRKEIDPFYEWWSSHVKIGVGCPRRSLQFRDVFTKYEGWAIDEKHTVLKKIAFVRKCMAEIGKCDGIEKSSQHGIATVHGNISVRNHKS